MDHWTGLTRRLTPLGGYEPRAGGEDAYRTLLAALIAHGTNLGVAAMSGSIEGMPPNKLHHASQWFLREATLKAASKAAVDHHHLLPLSATWGDATIIKREWQLRWTVGSFGEERHVPQQAYTSLRQLDMLPQGVVLP